MSQPIQEAISRMSNFQMKLKGFTIAIASATIFVGVDNWISTVSILLIMLIIWILDAYYLSIERKLRKKVTDLGSRELRNNETIWNNLFQKSTAIFHIPFLIITIVSLLNILCEWS